MQEEIIISGFGVFAFIALATVLQVSAPGAMDDQSPLVIVVGLGVIGCAGIAFLGLGLGLAGLLQSDRKKIFPILGTILNGMVLLVFLGIMAIGFAIQGA